MDDEVLAAMADAARHYVKIDELQDAAGRIIAEVTGAKSGYVMPERRPAWHWRPRPA